LAAIPEGSWYITAVMRVASLTLVFGAALLCSSPASGIDEEPEPNDSFELAGPLGCGGTLLGSIGGPNDVDFFLLSAVPANTVLQARVESEGVCLGGTNRGRRCATFSECPSGVCQKPATFVLEGFSIDRNRRFLAAGTASDTDPIATLPLENPAPMDFFLEVSAAGDGTGATYTLTVTCQAPQDLSCPSAGTGAASIFGIDFEGDLDVYGITVTESSRNLIFDIDADSRMEPPRTV
jgi:hypothetical protein